MVALVSGLNECAVDPKEADFFVTHMHADHSGLVSALAEKEAKIYFGRADAEVIKASTPQHWGKLIDMGRMCGFPQDEMERAVGSHPGRRYSPNTALGFAILRDGDEIKMGDYVFRCIETPGHTAGHICLYEPNKKIFICGDHILGDITPNITLSVEERNPLKEFLMSLDKVFDLDVELVLPGHRRLFRNQKERIRELKEHHQTRLTEVISILGKERQNAYQVASQMTWDIGFKSWDSFPASQKVFAFGEAMAHLKYLEEEGKVGWEMEKDGIVFFVRQNRKETDK